jgi:hypothetical protein
MHPAIMRQLAADHIRQIHAAADDQRRRRQARRTRRRAPSTRLRRPAGGPQPDMTEQPSAAPLPVMAGPPPDIRDATARHEVLDLRH